MPPAAHTASRGAASFCVPTVLSRHPMVSGAIQALPPQPPTMTSWGLTVGNPTLPDTVWLQQPSGSLVQDAFITS